MKTYRITYTLTTRFNNNKVKYAYFDDFESVSTCLINLENLGINRIVDILVNGTYQEFLQVD